MNVYIAFYLGGWVSSLLNARSQGNLTVSGSFYLLLWPLYGILTVTEFITQHSDSITAAGKSILRGAVAAVKWVITLFKAKQ